MITVSQARDAARKRLIAKQAAWAAAIGADAVESGAAALVLTLRPPTEREALADQSHAERWARDWSALDAREGLVIEWETRSWARIGRQRIPVRLRLSDSDAVARFVGGEHLRAWRRLCDRAISIMTRLGDSDAVRRAIRAHAADLTAFDEDRFVTMLDAASWLSANPVHGLRPRQLPIRGVDTKWFAAHRSILNDLHRAVTGADDIGIVDADPLVRVRVLDPMLAGSGPADFAAPAVVIAALPYQPAAVFVCENLETVLAMPPWPGAIAVHGSGYAVDVVGRLPWVSGAPVVYWGDLDSDGFAILNRLRSGHPRVTSVLMDERTLLAHRDLWVAERKPNRGAFATLTDEEAAALARIRAEGDVRLEQERIPWEFALVRLRTAWESVAGGAQRGG